jgi:hypothetical protein
MHRHTSGKTLAGDLSTEIVLVTQGADDLARWLRSKIDKTYYIEKLDAVGASSRYRCDVYQGYKSNTGRGKLIDSRIGKYQSSVYSLYSSHTLSESTGGVSIKELKPMKRSVWQSGKMKFYAVLLLICLGVVSYALPAAIEGMSTPPGASKSKPEQVHHVPDPRPATSSLVVPGPPPLKDKKGPGVATVSSSELELEVPLFIKGWLKGVHDDRYFVSVGALDGEPRRERQYKDLKCSQKSGVLECKLPDGSVVKEHI